MTHAAYDSIAEWYDSYINEGVQGSFFEELILPSLLDLVGKVSGQRVADVACGQGIVSRRLAQRGAIVTGIDLSQELLKLARRYEEEQQLGVQYLRDNAQALTKLDDASFDGAVCSMALMDIPDLPAIFRAVHRILAPGGWFAFCITHPCFEPPHAQWLDMGTEGKGISRQVQGYFKEGYWQSKNPLGVRFRVGAYHRTLSTYINTLLDAGFQLECLAEPQATGELATRVPGFAEVAAVLLVKATRK